MFYTKKRVLYTKVPKKKLSFLSISFVVLFSFLSFEATAQNTAQNIEINLDAIQKEIRELEKLLNTCRLAQSILQVGESEAIDSSESIAPELKEEDKNKLIALREERGKECLSAKQKVESSFFKKLWEEGFCFFSDNTYLDETPEGQRARESCDSNTVKNDGCYNDVFLQGRVLDQNCAEKNRNKCLESYWKEAHKKKPIAARIEEYKKIAAKEELFGAIYTEGYYKELFPDTIKDIEENCEWIEKTSFESGGARRYQRNPAACSKAKEALKSKIISIEDKDFYEKNLKAWEKDIQEKLKEKSKLIALLELEKNARYCIEEGKKGFNKIACKRFAHKASEEDKKSDAALEKCLEGAVAHNSETVRQACYARGPSSSEVKARINAIIAANKEYFKKLAEEADILQSSEKASLVAVASPKPQKRDLSSKAKPKAESQSKLTAQGESSTASALVAPATSQTTQAPSSPPVDSTVVTVSAPKEELCSKEYKQTLRDQERFQDFLDNCIAKEEPSSSCTTEEENLLKEKLKEILSSKKIDEEHIDSLINTMLEEAKKEKGWSLSRALAKIESNFKPGAKHESDAASSNLMQVYITDKTERYLRALIENNNIEYPDSTSSLKTQLLNDPAFNYKVAAALNRSSRIKSAAGREAEYLVGCTKIAETCRAIREETDAKKVLTLLSPLKGYGGRNIGWREEGRHAGSSAALVYAMKMEHLTKKYQSALPSCGSSDNTESSALNRVLSSNNSTDTLAETPNNEAAIIEFIEHKAEDNALLSKAITLYEESEKSDPNF